MLTEKQRELLLFINERLNERGVSPSYDEMKEALSLRSKSGIHRLINALEERGFIRRMKHRARALEVVRLPDALTRASSAQLALAEQPSPDWTKRAQVVVDGSRGRVREPVEDIEDPTLEVPVLGRIAAGTPIEAIQNVSEVLDLPRAMLGGGVYYALEVEGDSMIDAGILDGDVVVLERTETATNGDIVVALVDREEATLKKLRRKGNAIALEPANTAYQTRVFGPDRVQVQGRLVALIRRY